MIRSEFVVFISDVYSDLSGLFHRDVVALGFWVVFVGGVVLRLRFLGADMTYDEAEIFFMTRDPLFQALTSLRTSLHNLPIPATALSVALFGPTEWAVRLPYLLFGLAVMPAVFWCGAQLFDRRVGLIAGAAASVGWPLVTYSVGARGYISGTFAFILMLGLIPYLIRTGNRAALAAMALCGVLAGYSVQSMAFGYVIAMLVLMIGLYRSGRPDRFRRMLVWPAAVSTVVVVLLMALMSPVLLMHGLRGLTVGDHLAGHADVDAWGLLGHQLAAIWSEWGLDVPLPLALVLGGGFVLGVCRDGTARTLAFSMAVGVLPVFVLVGELLPPPRIWQFLLPPCAMISGCGLAAAARSLPRWPRHGMRLAVGLVVCAAAVVFVSALQSGNVISKFAGREPHEMSVTGRDFAAQLNDGDAVSLAMTDHPVFRYYMFLELGERGLFLINDRVNLKICSKAHGCAHPAERYYYFSPQTGGDALAPAGVRGSAQDTGRVIFGGRDVWKVRLTER